MVNKTHLAFRCYIPNMAANERLHMAALVSLWLGAVAIGSITMWRYSAKSGAVGAAVSDWPRNSSLSLDPARYNLILFAHPRCACTRASLTELAWLQTQTQNRMAVRVVFYKPAQAPQGWEKGELWNEASSMPGVSVGIDSDGTQAKLFGAATSGMVSIYSPLGRLAFRGGITGARAHEGDNPGLRAAIAASSGKTGGTFMQTLVFGCLFASSK